MRTRRTITLGSGYDRAALRRPHSAVLVLGVSSEHEDVHEHEHGLI
jgi:hypothetical protein